MIVYWLKSVIFVKCVFSSIVLLLLMVRLRKLAGRANENHAGYEIEEDEESLLLLRHPNGREETEEKKSENNCEECVAQGPLEVKDVLKVVKDLLPLVPFQEQVL